MAAKCFLSIDFEDAYHDFKMQKGIDPDPPLLKKELWAVYDSIERFCQEKLNGARLTFFCTGVIAQKMPEIIAKMAEDGHEIGCHYFHHNWVNKDSVEEFEKNIALAVEHLQKASGQKIKGFRAPYFSIEHTDIGHYKILEKYFDYDSSLVVNSPEEFDAFKRHLDLNDLVIFPILNKKVYSFLPPLKSGGTFLKIFSSSAMKKVIREGQIKDIAPMVYLHPYEFVTDLSFKLSFSDMKGMKLPSRVFSWLRAFQWHYVGNRTVRPKLVKIFEEFDNGGRIDTLLHDNS